MVLIFLSKYINLFRRYKDEKRTHRHIQRNTGRQPDCVTLLVPKTGGYVEKVSSVCSLTSRSCKNMPYVAANSCIYGGQQLRKLLHKFAPNLLNFRKKLVLSAKEPLPKSVKQNLQKLPKDDHACVDQLQTHLYMSSTLTRH